MKYDVALLVPGVPGIASAVATVADNMPAVEFKVASGVYAFESVM